MSKTSAHQTLTYGQVNSILKLFKIPEELTPEFVKRQFNTISRLAHIISQLSYESANFTRLSENMNYSATRLRQVFPSRVTVQQAQALAHKPREIANHLYGGRFGNNKDNDGWIYRGRSPLMITFKDNYRQMEEITGIPFVENPELMETMGYGMIASLAWLESRNINQVIAKPPTNYETVKAVTKVINGGYNGLDQRESLFHLTLNKIRKVIP